MSKKVSTVIVVFLTLAMILTACGSFSSPERTVEKYFSAVKTGDMDKSIECLTPAIQEQYKASVAITNALSGIFGFSIDSESLFEGLIGTINPGAYKNYDFKVAGSTETDSTHAIVTVAVYIDGSISSTTNVYCTKIDGEWYIEG